MDYRKAIAAAINIGDVSAEEICNSVTLVTEEGMGDYTLPCFRFAKALRKAPAAIAEELKNTISLPGVSTSRSQLDCVRHIG